MCLGFMWFVSKQSPAPLQGLLYEGGSGAGVEVLDDGFLWKGAR